MTTATAEEVEAIQDIELGASVDTEEAGTGTESFHLGDGDGADNDVEAAMLAGWKKADPEEPQASVKNTEAEEAPTEQPGTSTTTITKPNDEEDPVVPGLGMKASEVRAALGKVDSLEKSVASTAGNVGHLKQLVSQAGKGREVTAAQLENLRNEFGEEFAEAFAKDLSQLPLGGGSSFDPTAVDDIVNQRLQAHTQSLEKKAVVRAHKDADDHFARPKLGADGKPIVNEKGEIAEWERGPKFDAFAAFVGTLPADRQRELQDNGWDSDVIIRALDDFKSHEKKAADDKAKQTNRTARAAAPTRSGGAPVQPVVDPLEEGWKRAGGSTGRGRQSQGARR